MADDLNRKESPSKAKTQRILLTAAEKLANRKASVQKYLQKRRQNKTEENEQDRRTQKRISTSKLRAKETTQQKIERQRGDQQRQANARAAETMQQRKDRQSMNQQRQANARAAETMQQKEERQRGDQQRQANARAEETMHQRKDRQRLNQQRQANARAAETMQQKEERQRGDQQRQANARAEETMHQREDRQRLNQQRQANARAVKTMHQREERQRNDQQRKANARALETMHQREERQRNDQQRKANAKALETMQQKKERQRLNQQRQAKYVANAKRRKIQSQYCARNPSTNPIVVLDLGTMEIECLPCKALHFIGEISPTCCAKGKVSLSVHRECPEPLLSWLSENNDAAKHFRSCIRKYNGAFAFASFGYQPATISTRGPPVFKIHGQVYHRTARSVSNQDPRNSIYSELYILDPDFATTTRHANPANTGCDLDTMAQLESLIRRINPYALAYKMMQEVSQEYSDSTVEMWLVKDPKYDKRIYNLPVAKNEVAAVFKSSENNEEFINRDICIHSRDDRQPPQHIRTDNPNCDPMTYPLLFPYGDQGWNYKLEYNGKKISYRAFYAYHLQTRPEKFNQLLHSGKLTQQFMVDAFLKVESDRLNYVRHNQKQLRVDTYLGLMDYVSSQAQQQNLKPGKMVILPSTFTGGKRAMQEGYQDAMTMVAAFGKPDLFITFTCNAQWKEITSNLLPGETAVDRPDLTARVFRLKLKEFMNDMTKNNIFGKVLAYQSVIEFQKRGLPHCHMLFILEDEDKPREPEEVDTIVCAEIPDEEQDPELFRIVTTTMMHGPCGSFNLKNSCMEEDSDGKLHCSKKFPKDFANETILHDNGYPEYRRRRDGKTATIRGHILDNGWVVPYNPYLCKKYNAHINVEVCSSIKSVKYIYKYIYKGYDSAVVRINAKDSSYNWDEVQAYIDTRYLAAPEAMWRLFKFPLQDRSHAIYRLPVHLPSEQNVMFSFNEVDDDNDAIQTALDAAERRGTKLTQWFRLNQQDPHARQFVYREIPYHYRYDQGHWTSRIKSGEKILARLYTVNPRNMELFSLRLLLLNVKGPTCFEDLRTVNGYLYNTFQAAAKELQLLDDDSHLTSTLEEACVFNMPSQLRILFGNICEFCYPADPKALYLAFRDYMIEDYLRQSNDEDIAVNKCLQVLEDYFVQFSHSCAHFGLPSPKEVTDVSDFIVNVEQEKSDVERLIPLLNDGQRAAYKEIINAVDGISHTKCFFVSGPGGSGKTFLYSLCIATLYSRRQRVKAVAPTGLAATLLKNGQTVHSGFGLPLDINGTSISKIRQGSKEWKMLKETKLIIWDEISMCTKDMLETVDRSLRDLMNTAELFGGITIVVGGDFRQQAPVLKRAGRYKVIEACIKRSKLWQHFKELPLTVNMRVNPDEIEFTNWLLKIGSGRNEENCRSEFVKISEDLLSSCIISTVYDDINSLSRDDLASRAVLCPLNKDTLRINEIVLGMLPGDLKTFSSIDTVTSSETEEEQQLYPVEFLNSITPMGLPPHKLNLKLGCCVMLLRNLNPKQGLCNGTRLIVEQMNSNVLDCSIFSGKNKGSRVFIPRICLDTSEADVPFKLRRKQFPLRLAYSMTITKSQGQTFDRIGIYLPKPVFAHGQLYTALSRVKSKTGLALEILPGLAQGKLFEDDENMYTFNCVFDEIL